MALIPELFSSTHYHNTNNNNNYHYSELSELPLPPSVAEFCNGGAMWNNNCTAGDFMVPYGFNDFASLEGLSLLSSSSSTTEKLGVVNNCDGVVPSFCSDEYRNYISDNNIINNINLIDGIVTIPGDRNNFGEIVYNNNNNNSNIIAPPLDNNNTFDHVLFGDDYCCDSRYFSPEFKPFGLVAGERNNKWGMQSNEVNGIVEESNILKVGRYSEEERKERIVRYLKKRNQRNFNKTIKYACRKTLADRRVRVRGRFARNNKNEVYDHQNKDTKLCCDDGLQVIKYDDDEDWLQNFALCCWVNEEDQLLD